jgi:isoleucyl-tRNA synthetase
VIFRATEQWFIRLDNRDMRQKSLEEIKRVKWTPEWGEERIHNMIVDRPDWCISRQRFWGVPLIIFYCEACGKLLEDYAALRNVVRWFEKEGADAWYTHSAEELLPPGATCPTCGAAKWHKEKDVLDVWFDSGSTNLVVLSEKDGTWPADVYLEGPDQYRGWFQSSLLVAMGVRGRAPYKQVVTHGWTLDEKGAPMSKSLGNSIEPREICEKWGADLLRVWVSSQDYTADVRISEAMMKQLAEAYRKIRNTFRFAISNLFDFDPQRQALPDGELWEMDAWMMRRTGTLARECREWFEKFEFHRVYHAVHDFCVVDLSSFYFDVLKDRLYTFAPNSPGRRSAQTAVYRIAHALVRLIAPTLTFTSEEVWKFLPHAAGDPQSIHETYFPEAGELENALDEIRSGNWDRLRGVREEVLKALEPVRAAKSISSGLEARVTLTAGEKLAALLNQYAAFLPELFIVSKVEIKLGRNDSAGASGASDGLIVEVDRAPGAKCERCWNYSLHVGESAEYPTICERCLAALAEIERASEAGSART